MTNDPFLGKRQTPGSQFVSAINASIFLGRGSASKRELDRLANLAVISINDGESLGEVMRLFYRYLGLERHILPHPLERRRVRTALKAGFPVEVLIWRRGSTGADVALIVGIKKTRVRVTDPTNGTRWMAWRELRSGIVPPGVIFLAEEWLSGIGKSAVVRPHWRVVIKERLKPEFEARGINPHAWMKVPRDEFEGQTGYQVAEDHEFDRIESVLFSGKKRRNKRHGDRP
jgi:hypothetical protein